MTRPAIVLLTASALPTAQAIAAALPDGEVWGLAGRVEAGRRFDDAGAALRGLFAEGRPIVGLCAAGILVRALAPLLADKTVEPAVLAVAEDGSAVVPLLGGHAGGGNALARRVAAALGVAPAITTGSELRLGAALDAPPPGWTVAGAVKPVAAHLLAGGGVRLEVEVGDAGWLGDLPVGDGPPVRVTDRAVAPAAGLLLHPPTLALGVGGERGVDPAELRSLVAATLAEAGLAPASVAAVGTLDLKADEPAMMALAAALERPLRLFDAAALEAETPRLASPSEAVFQAVGCHGVAEAAALALAGPAGGLVVAKRKSARATCAVARAPHGLPLPLAGRPRGTLSIVGVGPGRPDWRTAAAAAAVGEADLVLGYAGYLDLVGDLVQGRATRAYALGEERARALTALQAAGAGQRVALVCSGDAGIYAMAALVYELVDQAPAPGGPVIEVIPGVSAAQAAAARAGAPLGHDFCCISLSDLLTPWPAIERRLRAAAAGDFVIALYNPASGRRREPLRRALAILAEARPPQTPVVLARAVGRPEESVRIAELAGLDAGAVDMLTILIVGSSETRRLSLDGAPRVYTPRGYRSGSL